MAFTADKARQGSAGGSDYEIENSLRFNDDDSACLTFTPSGSQTNNLIGTWSFWTKKTEAIDNNEVVLFDSRNSNGSAGFVQMGFHYDNDENSLLFMVNDSGGNACLLVTTAQYRDPSAWYHICVVYDSPQATASNRVKIYVNGEQVTEFNTETYPPQNKTLERWCESGMPLSIGSTLRTSNRAYYDGYMAEFHYIDGQAKTPSDFGESGDYGEWKPVEYTGTYGTNGFYLPFKQDATVEGFSAVTYTGDSTLSHLIQGVGYQPDVVWLKTRTNQADSHALFDAVRGGGYHLRTDSNLQHLAGSFSYDTDGFTLGNNDGQTNSSNNTYIAWTWDMGGTTVSNTNGSITSSVRANSAYGQSIVKYTGVGGSSPTSNTIGHGLAAAPEMIILKKYTQADSWQVYHKDLDTYTLSKLILDTNAAQVNDGNGSSFGSPRNIGSSTFTIGYNGSVSATGEDHIAYCFHSVTGYSKFGSYTGDATTNGSLSVTVGFRPAFLMVKKTNGTGNWIMVDTARNGDSNNINKYLKSNTTDVDATGLLYKFTSTGFTIHANLADINSSGGTYIYMAFADTREYSFFTDQSTNSNHWTPNNISSVADVMLDTPSNNFCTWNPLDESINGMVYSEGNTKSRPATGNNHLRSNPTMFSSSGKWYAEFIVSSGYISDSVWIGIIKESAIHRDSNNDALWHTQDGAIGYDVAGTFKVNTSTISTGGTTWAAGDVMSVALDMDNQKFYLGKNGSWLNSANPVGGTGYFYNSGILSDGSWGFTLNGYGSSGNETTWVANFGQDSSFAGNKTAQGNQDSNAIGDFYYTPPSGFLALCSSNLPSATVIPSEHFNTVTYTGDGTDNRSITGVGFQPDFIWGKARSNSNSHRLADVVRGATKILMSDANGAEYTGQSVVSFDSDGYTTSRTGGNLNDNGWTYAAWNWKAGGTAVSNTNGTITSSVSANVDAGFSVVTYSGHASNTTVGHGLTSKAPEAILVKNISWNDASSNWTCYFAPLTSAYNMRLNGTNAQDGGNHFNGTISTSTFFVSTSYRQVNNSGNDYIAYCFHSVDGHSKIGSYTGNGSADGTFVYTGFKPAYVMVKESVVGTGNGGWAIFDNKRSENNVADDSLYADTSGAESVNNSYQMMDILSNGFKLRSPSLASQINYTTSYIFIAFAEQPFKHSNAR
jgi:hypothetical protein